jgi:hypothetical protein
LSSCAASTTGLAVEGSASDTSTIWSAASMVARAEGTAPLSGISTLMTQALASYADTEQAIASSFSR